MSAMEFRLSRNLFFFVCILNLYFAGALLGECGVQGGGGARAYVALNLTLLIYAK